MTSDSMTKTGSMAQVGTSRSRSRFLVFNTIAALATCVILTIILGWLCKNRLNTPDAIYYLRLASYYEIGRPDLAVSGHWSPLISLLMAPLLWSGIDPLVTARIVVGLSGLLFWAGSLLLLKRMNTPAPALAFAAWCLAFACASWSVATTTPDLLAAGLICFATATLLSDDWAFHWKWQTLAGIIWAMAYFAKAVALPLCVLTCIGVAAWRCCSEACNRRAAIRSVVLTLAAFLVLASPWVAVLSIKFDRFTISTAARAARTDIGPNAKAIWHWERVPESGRISAYEAFDYPPAWSPFENLANAGYQVKLLGRNAKAIVRNLKELDYLSIGVTSVLAALVLVAFDYRLIRKQKWMTSLVPVLSLAAIYVTTYCYDLRYYWVLLPFFLALSFGLVQLASDKMALSAGSRNGLLALIVCSFTMVPVRSAFHLVRNREELNGLLSHREMARKLKDAGYSGPIVGSTDRNWRCALSVAYFLNQPYYGDPQPATVTEFRTAKARIVIVDRNEPVAKDLASDVHFRDLDLDLFGDSEKALQCELRAFELVR